MGENASLCISQPRKQRDCVPTGIAFPLLVWGGKAVGWNELLISY